MPHSHYLIVGGSHAALEALQAIRMHDPDGSVAVINRDRRLPYSPTVLPYVVSGRSHPDRVALRDAAWFTAQAVHYESGVAVTAIDPATRRVTLDDGRDWHYEKLLLATGATPLIPPIDGLEEGPFRVMRTLDDALAMRDASGAGHRALVLGAGLVGMHAAENLVAAGLDVTLVERGDQVLPGYFDATAAGRIADAFHGRGATLKLGRTATGCRYRDGGVTLTLDDGSTLDGDLLLVSAGVRPAIDFVAGSGIETDIGILVDDRMRTSIDTVWAAGDAAQARNFYGGERVVGGILPDAVEQGRIAGMAMAGDPGVVDYSGSVPINTYHFFGQQAIAVGRSAEPDDGALDIDVQVDATANSYRKLVLRDGRLHGAAGINCPLDAGILWQLILRRTDLAPHRDAFVANPQAVGRRIMSTTWR